MRTLAASARGDDAFEGFVPGVHGEVKGTIVNRQHGFALQVEMRFRLSSGCM